jgi:hypothetical protein
MLGFWVVLSFIKDCNSIRANKNAPVVSFCPNDVGIDELKVKKLFI